MWHIIKRTLWIWLLVSGLPACWAYSLGGPIGNNPKPNGNAIVEGDAWQTAAIGYGVGGDLNAPKNLGEEYRQNSPVFYYAYDANFVDFFQTNGMGAVDSAFGILNALTNVDSYSTTLSEFPFETRHLNYEAQALGLYDLKSFTLGLMMEQMGLADPIRYDWTLHDRIHYAGTPPCPLGMGYLVVQRNFDPVGYPVPGSTTVLTPYSPYVNNTLYSYQIIEVCAPGPELAVSVPYAADPLADVYSPVASSTGGLLLIQSPLGLLLTAASGIASYGTYYTGLTRDDVAGLKYLLSTNNVNWESPEPGALAATTVTNGEILLISSDLGALLSAAQTTPAALLPGLFPGVVAVPGNPPYTFTEVVTTNVVLTINPNAVDAPYGFGVLQETVTVQTNFQQVFLTSFANIITNGNLTNTPNVVVSPGITLSYSTNTVVQFQTTAPGLVTAPPGTPYGNFTVITNMTVSTVTLNVPSGEYLVLPPGACGFNILLEIPLPPVLTTNIIASATNANGSVDTVAAVTSFTPHEFVVQPITCGTVAPVPALYEGIGNVKYVRADFDSLLGQTWQPVTNNYTMVTVTNGRTVTVHFQRIATAPDFLFSADDITSGPGTPPAENPVVATYDRSLTFDQANALSGLAGPGTIPNPATPDNKVTFNKVSPAYYNGTLFVGDVMNGTPYFTADPGNDFLGTFYQLYYLWGSFDGTTNDPVVYPAGTPLPVLTGQILTQILPSTLPVVFSDVLYTNIATFTASGGGFSPPFTWSASALPDGLSLSSDGTLSGTPSTPGTYDFSLILTDSLGRSGQWGYTITIQ